MSNLTNLTATEKTDQFVQAFLPNLYLSPTRDLRERGCILDERKTTRMSIERLIHPFIPFSCRTTISIEVSYSKDRASL